MFGGGSIVRSGADSNIVSTFPIFSDGVGFVVVSGEPPAGREDTVLIGDTIVVGIGSFGKVGHLGDTNLVTGNGIDTATVVKARGKKFPFPLSRVGGGFCSHDIATTQNRKEGAVRGEVDPTYFWGNAGRELDILNLVGSCEERSGEKGEKERVFHLARD